MEDGVQKLPCLVTAHKHGRLGVLNDLRGTLLQDALGPRILGFTAYRRMAIENISANR
jgi:hypothetical protein